MIQMTEEGWRAILSGESPDLRRGRHLFGLIPSNPRCKLCYAPFRGIGAPLMRLLGKRQFSKNPNFCNTCLMSGTIGGVEIEITMLFADVRGSTTLAEQISPSEFSRLLNRFYKVSTDVLIQTDAWIDKLVGDEIIGLYIPGFAGPDHAHLAVHAAGKLLHATSHGEASGPWVPVGVGVHTGVAYVGLVGSEGGISDLTALGDAMNTTARLASSAGPGEILVSEAASTAAKLDVGRLEGRQLQLKGRSEPVAVRVMRAADV